MCGQFFLLIFITLLSVCSGQVGEAGRLKPQAGDGVQLIQTKTGNDTAQLTVGENVKLNIGGAWANQSFQRLEIQIDNQSAQPFSFDFSSVGLQGDTGEKLVLNRVTDTTGVDNSDNNPNNDTVQELYKQDVKSADNTLTVAPHQRRDLTLQFNNFTAPENKLSKGKTIIVSISAHNTAERKIFFKCED